MEFASAHRLLVVRKKELMSSLRSRLAQWKSVAVSQGGGELISTGGGGIPPIFPQGPLRINIPLSYCR